MRVSEIVTNVQEMEHQLKELAKAINTIRGMSGHEILQKEEDVKKDERMAVKLLYKEWRACYDEYKDFLNAMMFSEVDVAVLRSDIERLRRNTPEVGR